MQRKSTIAWISNSSPRLLRKACARLPAKVIGIVPEKAPILFNAHCDLVVVDLRIPTSIDLVEIGRRFKEMSDGPAVAFVISHDDTHTADRIDTVGPDGILAEPLSPVFCRLVVNVAFRSRQIRRSRSLAASKHLIGVVAPAPLTRREMDILELFAGGHRVKSIARSCFIAEGTVRAHLKSVFRKLKVRSQGELMERLLGDRS